MRLFLFFTLCFAALTLTAQQSDTIFYDNFESYGDGFDLNSIPDYTVWEGSAKVVDTTAASGRGVAFEGVKFGQTDNLKVNLQVRYTDTLTPGQMYVWELATKIQDGAKHFMNVLPGTSYGVFKKDFYNADWEKHKVKFVVNETDTIVTIALYRYGKKVVGFDDWLLRKASNKKTITNNALGAINEDEKSIMVPHNTLVETLVNSLEVSQYAEFDVLTTSGGDVVADQDVTIATKDMVVSVMAEDSTRQEYSIVLPVLVSSIEVSADYDTVLVENTLQLSATVLPGNAENANLTWHLSSASDSASATITSNGLLTGVAPDTVFVVAKSTDGSEITDSFEVRIVARPLNILVESIEVSAVDDSVEIGKTLTLSATVLPLNATNPKVVWSLSSAADSTLATIVAGELTGVKAGVVTVIATSTDGTNVFDNYEVEVYEKPSGIGTVNYDVQVYPNPVKNQLFINSQDFTGTYNLYNAVGQVVISGSLSTDRTIDVSGLNTGMYLLKLTSLNSESIIKILKE